MTITEESPHMTTNRRLSTRAELAERHSLSIRTLDRLWRDRETNGHPEPADVDPLRWDTAAWGRWFRKLPAGTGTGTTTVRTPPPPPAGAPGDLIGPSEFARILGLQSQAWVSRAARTLPAGFPAPDEYSDPHEQRGPKWRRSRAEAYARKRPTLTVARPGRPKGSTSKATPYAGDPRLTLARRALAELSDKPARQAAARLAADHPDTSMRTWERIIRAAQDHPEAGA